MLHFVLYMTLTGHTIKVSSRDVWSTGSVPEVGVQDGILPRCRFSTFMFNAVAEGRTHVIDMKKSLLVDEKQRKLMPEGKGPGRRASILVLG